MCALHMYSAHRGQKKESDSLELKLGIVMSHHVGAERWMWVLKLSLLSQLSRCPAPFDAGSNIVQAAPKHTGFAASTSPVLLL